MGEKSGGLAALLCRELSLCIWIGVWGGFFLCVWALLLLSGYGVGTVGGVVSCRQC